MPERVQAAARRIEWPTAAVLIALIIATVVVLAIVEPAQQVTVLAGIGTAGGTLLALMRQLVRQPDKRPPASSGGSASRYHEHVDGDVRDLEADERDAEADADELHRTRVSTMGLAGAALFGGAKVAGFLVGVALALSGCGASALRVQAGTAHVVGVTLDDACHRVSEARQTAQEAARDAAESEVASKVALDAVRAAYAPAVGGCNAVSELHGGWADALAIAAAGDDVTLADSIGWARRLVVAWSDLVPALAAVGIVLPAPPAALTALAGGAQ